MFPLSNFFFYSRKNLEIKFDMTVQRKAGNEKMKPRILIILLYIGCYESKQSSKRNPNVFNIGGVLSNNNSESHFKRIVQVNFYLTMMKNLLKLIL